MRLRLAALPTLALLIGCGPKGESTALKLPESARLVSSEGGWAIEGEGLSALPSGTFVFIHGPKPLPGSQIFPVIGLAQAKKSKSGDGQGLNILYQDPKSPISKAGVNPISALSDGENARVGRHFARGLAQQDGGIILNIGALDGVTPNARYSLVKQGESGSLTSAGSCVVPGESLESTYSVCIPEGPLPPIDGLFARLDEPEEGGQELTSSGECAPAPSASPLVTSLDHQSACVLLEDAYLEFVDRFGPGGSGGSLGVYLDQRYLSAEAQPQDATQDESQDGWTPPPDSSRMDTRVRAFLEDPIERVLLIMGPMGAGKTTFSRRFSYDLALETMKTGQGPIPLRVSLSDTVSPEENLYELSGSELIARVIKERLGQDIDPEALRQDVIQGRIIPLFDGFDEVAMRGATSDSAQYFRDLGAEFDEGQSKVIVLSRSSDTKGEGLLGLTLALEQAIYDVPSQELLFLIPFNQDIIERYLERLVADPEDRALALERLDAYFDLKTLSRTPLLVYLVARFLTNEEGDREMPTDIYGLYRLYTSDWAEGTLASRGLSTKETQSFMRRAMAMGLALDQSRSEVISEEELSSFIATFPWTEASLEADDVWREGLQEARGAAFLKPTRQGGYRFIHPSFAHYFTSEGLLQQLRYVWMEDAPEWGHRPFLQAMEDLRPSQESMEFLREGMGPDPIADGAIQLLLDRASEPFGISALFRLRLTRQQLLNPEEGGGDAIAHQARFTYEDLYRAEGDTLKAESLAGAKAFLDEGGNEAYRLLDESMGVLVDLKDGTEWVYIPGGEFLRGTVAAAGDTLEKISVQEPFLLSRFPVTNAEYEVFETKGGYSPHPSPTYQESIPYLGLWSRGRSGIKMPEELADLPVVGISQKDIQAYCNWLTRLSPQLPVRLPSAAEWELAARGRLGRRFPWGDGWDGTKVPNMGEGLAPRGVDLAPGPFGNSQMAGGVWEWTLPGLSTGMEGMGVMKGGAFTSDPSQTASYVEGDAKNREMRRADLGFRLRRPAR